MITCIPSITILEKFYMNLMMGLFLITLRIAILSQLTQQQSEIFFIPKLKNFGIQIPYQHINFQ